MNELKNAMAEVRQNLIDFEQKLVRTSSLTGHEEDAARLVLAEMQKLNFDEAKIDSYGNVMGRMGNGPKQIIWTRSMHWMPTSGNTVPSAATS